jgi:hypothetical protein
MVTPSAGVLAKSYRSASRSACRFSTSGFAAFMRAMIGLKSSAMATGA